MENDEQKDTSSSVNATDERNGVRRGWRHIFIPNLTEEELALMHEEQRDSMERKLPEQGTPEHINVEIIEYKNLLKDEGTRSNWKELFDDERTPKERRLADIDRIKQIRKGREGLDWHWDWYSLDELDDTPPSERQVRHNPRDDEQPEDF